MSLLEKYSVGSFRDELFTAEGSVRPQYKVFTENLEKLGSKEILRRQEAAEKSFMSLGITFSVYEDGRGIERIFPFDLIPKIIDAVKWNRLETGLQQRVKALNLFLNDIYNEGEILKESFLLIWCFPDPDFFPSAKDFILPREFGVTSVGLISSSMKMESIMFWKITCVFLPEFPMYWKTGRS